MMDLGILMYSVIHGWFDKKLKVYRYFLNFDSWQKIKQTRAELKKIKNISDKELIKDVTGNILFQEIQNPILKYIINPLLNVYWKIVKKLI